MQFIESSKEAHVENPLRFPENDESITEEAIEKKRIATVSVNGKRQETIKMKHSVRHS